MAQPQGSSSRPKPHPLGGQHAPTIGVDTLDHRHLYEFDAQLEALGRVLDAEPQPAPNEARALEDFNRALQQAIDGVDWSQPFLTENRHPQKQPPL